MSAKQYPGPVEQAKLQLVILGVFGIKPFFNCQNTSVDGRLERTQWCVVQPILANIKKVKLTTNGASRRRVVGENVGDEIVDECQQSSKRLKEDEQGQCNGTLNIESKKRKSTEIDESDSTRFDKSDATKIDELNATNATKNIENICDITDDWEVLEPPVERCLHSIARLDKKGLKKVAKTVIHHGVCGAKHDLAKDLTWGREFLLCERAGSKIENGRKILDNTLKVQKTLQDMHQVLLETLSNAGGGGVPVKVIQAFRKLLLPGFISSRFFIRILLNVYIGGKYHGSIMLAEFDVPTQFDEMSKIVTIARMMLNVKNIFKQTIKTFTLMEEASKKKKHSVENVLVPSRIKEHVTPKKKQKTSKTKINRRLLA
ncbi:916_t:CDS:2, partial [Paraglomus occultum]